MCDVIISNNLLREVRYYYNRMFICQVSQMSFNPREL